MHQRLTDQSEQNKEDVCQPQKAEPLHACEQQDVSEVVVMKQQRRTHTLHERTVCALMVRLAVSLDISEGT